LKFKNGAIFCFLAIALLNGCGEKEKIDENMIVEKKVQKHQIPTLNLTTTTGKKIEIIADAKKGWKFKGLENKVVLLDFFGTWCPPCKAEIPHLNNIRKKLKKDFEIIGIDIGPRGGGVNSVKHETDFIKKFNIKYPITLAGDNNKLFSMLQELNPGGSIPFMILFNKKGEFVQYYIGMKPEEMLFNDINTAIGQ